jgi:hypothetical protein
MTDATRRFHDVDPASGSIHRCNVPRPNASHGHRFVTHGGEFTKPKPGCRVNADTAK